MADKKNRTDKREPVIKFKKPAIEKGSDGTAGFYKLLEVDGSLRERVWREDVAAGGVQFKDCNIVLKKPDCRTIVVETDNEEQGYMAVSYIHSMLMERKRRKQAEVINSVKSVYTPEGWDIDNQEDRAECDDDDDDIWEDEICDDDDDDEISDLGWKLNHGYLPLVPLEDVEMHLGEKKGQNGLPSNNLLIAQQAIEGKLPYWMFLGNKPICIVKDEASCFGPIDDHSIEAIRSFEDSDWVFLLYIRRTKYSMEGLFPGIFIDDDEDEDGDTENRRAPDVMKAILNLTADYIYVGSSEDEKNRYYSRLLLSWMEELHLELENGSELETLAEKLAGINPVFPSDTMLKALELLKHNEPDTKTVSLDKMLKLGIMNINRDPVDDMSMERLVGMDKVKEDLKSVVQLLAFNRNRRRAGNKGNTYHNAFLFLGAPGTAKTTMAKVLGKMLREEGLIPGGRFTSVSGSQLKAGFVGHTADKVKRLFRDNDIILIDEAYSLAASYNGQMDTFAQEALAQLAIELEEHAEDKVVIFAGYGGKYVTKQDNRMAEFLLANPGIRSRISFEISFPSYNAEELVKMVHFIAKERGFRIKKEADQMLYEYFDKRSKDSNFGNGREARNLVENAERILAGRYYHCKKMPKGTLTITEKDIALTIDCLKRSEGYGGSGLKYGII